MRQGKDVMEHDKISRSYKRLSDLSWVVPSQEVSHDLYISTADPPPSRNDSSVMKLCEVKWSENIKCLSLPKWTNREGQAFRKLDYKIVMNCEQGIVDFTVLHKGKQVAEKNVDVQFD